MGSLEKMLLVKIFLCLIALVGFIAYFRLIIAEHDERYNPNPKNPDYWPEGYDGNGRIDDE